MTCRRRIIKAERCCSSMVGILVGSGLTASPKRASNLASTLSVFANCPMDRANSRTLRGLTKATGRPSDENSVKRACSNPPVDSTTISLGCRSTNLIASLEIEAQTFGTDQDSSLKKMSSRALLTSTPTIPKYSSFILPFLFSIIKLPVLAEFGLYGPHNCSGNNTNRPSDPCFATVF